MDVDKGTFVRFAQFAYTGDYSIPKGSTAQAVVDQPNPFVPRPSAQELDDEWDSFRPKKGKKSKSVPEPPTSTSDIFNSLKYPLIESRSNLCTCTSSMNDGLVESSSEVLLTHASLYILAEKWGVNSLKMLVLSKLHQTLSTLRLDALKVQVVIDLARYTYLDSSTPDLELEIDGLRKLICLYIAANVEVVSEHTSFMDLIKGGCAFVRDIWKRVVPKKPSSYSRRRIASFLVNYFKRGPFPDTCGCAPPLPVVLRRYRC
jgi:hypothetical protein